jgi:hydrogenase expression/formation protein HypC
VIAVDADRALLSGTVDFAGTRREVCLAYVPDVKVGDHVVVHVGFAISIVDETEAAHAWTLLEQITDPEPTLRQRQRDVRD